MLKIILSIIVLVAAIPLAFLLAYLTKDEKQIYKKYFTPLLWIFAILAAIFYSLNVQVALTFSFMFVLVFVWNMR